MRSGVFICLLNYLSLEGALQCFSSLGVRMIELGCGGTPGSAYCNPEVLLRDETTANAFRDAIKKYNVEISVLSCHGDPVHPQQEVADMCDRAIRNSILMAERLGIRQISTSSGCLGDQDGAKYPDWVTCPWSDDFSEMLRWQWEEKLTPHWRKLVPFAKDYGVDKIAFRMHPGFCVYNVETMLKTREAVSPELGASFNPSHLVWQGVDPVAAIWALGDSALHFHAKDTRTDAISTVANGVLNIKHYSDEIYRSWVSRNVGYGHDLLYWRDIIPAPRMAGYDYAISTEHEDSPMNQNEGLPKAVEFPKQCTTPENASEMWWA